MLYLTAWIDEEGILNFRDDIYGRDVALQIALKQRPPSY
jgi:murein L,D-transpeptidase YcbB/YkuD